MSNGPNIFTFMSYRRYIRAFIDAAREVDKKHSLAYFSKAAGFSPTSNGLWKILELPEQRLVEPGLTKLLQAMDLDPAEQQFFKDLVDYDHCGADAAAQAVVHRRILGNKRFREANPLTAAHYEYLSCWYIVAIRELATLDGFLPAPEWIAAQLCPPITRKEAEHALEVLHELGFLSTDGTTSPGLSDVLKTGHEVQALGVSDFHRQMLERARGVLDSGVPSSMRHFNAATLRIRDEDIPELKAFIDRLVEKAFEFDDTAQARSVYQLQVALFPLSNAQPSRTP